VDERAARIGATTQINHPQFEHPTPALSAGMIALIIGEVGSCAVILAGFVAGQLF
jgi:hypothetical protein